MKPDTLWDHIITILVKHNYLEIVIFWFQELLSGDIVLGCVMFLGRPHI